MESDIVVYTTDRCGHCVSAKRVLAERGLPYREVNLARDPDGRSELVRRTGQMSFPTIVIDGRTVGGLRELLQDEELAA